MKQLSRPTGAPPPARAKLADGTVLDLVGAAEEVARRYFDEFPDDRERYSAEVWEWAVHDTRYILSWGAGDLNGLPMLERQTAWLARVLAARDFPLDRLARNVELAGAVLAERLPERRAEIEALFGGVAAAVGSD